MSDSGSDLDPFGLAAPDDRPHWTLGGADVTSAIAEAHIRQQVDQVGEVEAVLDLRYLGADPADFLARLVVRRPSGHVFFVGQVTEAAPQADGRLRIEAASGTQLTEQVLDLAAMDVSAAELSHLVARQAGYAEEDVLLPGLEDLEYDVFEILVPIHGLGIADRTRVRSVSFLTKKDTLERLEDLGLDDEKMRDADCFALALATAQRGYDAEIVGLEDIDEALSVLNTRSRYGLATLPDGQSATFRREDARADVRRGDLVTVRSINQSRRWTRSSELRPRDTALQLRSDDPLLAAFEGDLTDSERLALGACGRAARIRDPLARVTALWEAIEFLTAGHAPPPRFAAHDIATLLRSLPTTLDSALLQRAQDKLNEINNPPLMARLRSLIDTHGLDCSETELDQLAQLRRTRNRAAHGQDAAPPSTEQLDAATALVSRLVLLKRWRDRKSPD